MMRTLTTIVAAVGAPPVASDAHGDAVMSRRMRPVMGLGALLAALGIALGLAPHAKAEEPDIYGFITSEEAQEIWANGWRNCGTLDRTSETDPPVTSGHVIGIIEGYMEEGWDLESAGDIVWESVEGRCSDYMPQVERAMRSYGPMD